MVCANCVAMCQLFFCCHIVFCFCVWVVGYLVVDCWLRCCYVCVIASWSIDVCGDMLFCMLVAGCRCVHICVVGWPVLVCLWVLIASRRSMVVECRLMF